MDIRYSERFVHLIINGDEMHLAAGPEGVKNAIQPLFKNYLRGVNEASAKKSLEKVMNDKIKDAVTKILTNGQNIKFESVHIDRALETVDSLMGFGIFNFYIEKFDQKTGRLVRLDMDAISKLAGVENELPTDQKQGD